MTTEATLHPVVRAARGWIGTPFVHQGRERGQGVDCVGLIIGVAHELGLSRYDDRNYARLPDSRVLIAGLEAHMDALPARAVQPGDVLLIAWHGGEPIHTAIYAGRTIIHALESIGRVSEHRLLDSWRRQVAGGYRYRGLAWPN